MKRMFFLFHKEVIERGYMWFTLINVFVNIEQNAIEIFKMSKYSYLIIPNWVKHLKEYILIIYKKW